MTDKPRAIQYKDVVQAVQQLCIDSCYQLPADVLGAIKDAAETETNPKAANILAKLIDNAAIASSERIPICQDTGLAIVFSLISFSIQYLVLNQSNNLLIPLLELQERQQ